MSDIELALISLSEATTKEISKQEDSIGFDKLSNDVKRGSRVGNTAKNQIEKELHKKIIEKIK